MLKVLSAEREADYASCLTGRSEWRAANCMVTAAARVCNREKKMTRLLICLALVSALVCACASSPPASEEGVRFVGGNGSSAAEAIVIKGVDDEANGVAAEHAWLQQNMPGWEVTGQSLLTKGRKSYDAMTVRSASGEERTIYFDITGFFGKLF